MAILAYLGAPRSGKSYSVVENNIIPALTQGRHVVTNIPLEKELLLQVFGGQITQLDTDDVLDPDLPDRIPNGVVLVLDEIWRRWPSGQKVNRASLKDLELLKEHGHKVDKTGKTMQIVLVTQNAADLALWVRDLVKFSFVHEKLDAVGMDERFSIKIYRGCPTGKNIPEKFKVRESFSTYKPEVYQFYKSATQSEADDLNVGDEQVMDKRANIWRSPGLLAQLVGAPVVFVLASLFLWSTISKQVNPPEQDQVAAFDSQPALVNPPPAVEPTPEPLSVAVPNPEPSSAPSDLSPSNLWRVSGYVHLSTHKADKPWLSQLGYGDQPEPSGQLKLKRSMVILTSMSGTRYHPLDDCTPYPDGINYWCDIDGERITPWSGQMGLTDILPGTAASRVVGSDAPARTSTLNPAPIL